MAITFSTRIGPGFTTKPTFEHMTFPAGESHVKVVNDNSGLGELTEIARVTGADANDLVTLGMWADAAKQRGATTIALMPYLPGARQDRGLPFGAAVYAKIINGFGIDSIVAFDAHSHVMPELIERLTVVDSAVVIRHAVVGEADSDEKPQRFAGIIAPDAGAVERAQRVADLCHLPLYRAEKHRDPDTGKLSGFTCETLPDTGRFLVVDDICDGGGTFMGLAASTGLGKDRLALWVSHGVFSGAAGGLVDHFGEIWTTDSFADDPVPATSTPSAFHVVPINRYLFGATS